MAAGRAIHQLMRKKLQSQSTAPSALSFLISKKDQDGAGSAGMKSQRALVVDNPVDSAKENLQEESQQKFQTVDARINHVQHELRSLIQKSNIASISTWMKNLGNTGEEKFRLIPMRRLLEDPMEVRLVQTRRPNEIKKATKTLEERRKEIEVRVAAARLLQQKSDSPQLPNDEDRASEHTLGNNRLGERRKHANMRKVASSADRMDQVRSYWNSMSYDKRKKLLEVSVLDLRLYVGSLKDSLAIELLSEVVSYAEVSKAWKFWICCRCSEKFPDVDSHLSHVIREHLGNLSSKSISILPQEVDCDWDDMLLNGSWKPLYIFASLKMMDDQSKCHSPMLVDNSDAVNQSDGSKEDETTDWCSKDAWYSSLDEEKCNHPMRMPSQRVFALGVLWKTETKTTLSTLSLWNMITLNGLPSLYDAFSCSIHVRKEVLMNFKISC